MALHVVARSGVRTEPGPSAPEIAAGLHTALADPDLLRRAVDGRELVVLGRRWQVEVFSVSENSGRHYVQLALRGDSDHMLTLRILPHADVSALLPRLLVWLAHPGPQGDIVEVG